MTKKTKTTKNTGQGQGQGQGQGTTKTKKKTPAKPAKRASAKKSPAKTKTPKTPAKARGSKAPTNAPAKTKAAKTKAPRTPAKKKGPSEGELVRERLYPYVGTHASTWELGHGAFVDLVVDRGMVVSNLSRDELEAAGLDLIEARELAIANLAAETGKVQAQVYEAPEGFPFLVWDAHWLAASSLLLPGLHGFAADQLDSQKLLACIPHRDALLIFPEGDADSRAAMSRMIQENEGMGEAPITGEFFSLLPDRVLPFSEGKTDGGRERGENAPPRWFSE